MSLSRWGPRSIELDAVEQRPRRRRDQHLTAVPGGHDPRCPMDVHAHVVRRHGERLARVDPDPDPDLDAGRPVRASEGSQTVGRRRDRVLGSRERHEQGVALLVHGVAGAPLECLQQQPPMELQHAGVGVRAEPFQELGRTLDIGEQEGDGPGRLRDHRATMAVVAASEWPAVAGGPWSGGAGRSLVSSGWR